MVNIQISFHPHILISMHVFYANDWCLSSSGRFHLWPDEAHTQTHIHEFCCKIYTTLIRYFEVCVFVCWINQMPECNRNDCNQNGNPEKYEHTNFLFFFQVQEFNADTSICHEFEYKWTIWRVTMNRFRSHHCFVQFNCSIANHHRDNWDCKQ